MSVRSFTPQRQQRPATPFDGVFQLAAALPRPQAKDDPVYRKALNDLKAAIEATPKEDVGKSLRRIVQRVISETADETETNVMFSVFAAQGRRWMGFQVIAVRNAVRDIGTSSEALEDLMGRSHEVKDRESKPVLNREGDVIVCRMAAPVQGTNFVSYAWQHDEDLGTYLSVLKRHGLTQAANELARHMREANQRRIAAGMRKEAEVAAASEAKVEVEPPAEAAEPPAGETPTE